MSKSYKKTPIGAITTAKSEKKDKKIHHKALRREYNTALKNFDEDDESVFVDERLVSNPYTWAKDGKQYFGDCKDAEWYGKALRK